MAETERDALFQALDALEALQIPYMVVGSFASTFWGRPRMTHDADLVVELPLEKVTELARLLAPHFYAPAFVIEDAVSKRGQFNLIHLDCAFKIDLWLRKDSPYAAAAFERRLLGIVFGPRGLGQQPGGCDLEQAAVVSGGACAGSSVPGRA